MFSKLFKKLLSETTNIADTTAVTFNTSGNYNPKYGKQKVYVSGRGGTGTTIPGNYFDNSYTNPGTYTPPGFTPGNTNPPIYTPGNTNPATSGTNAFMNTYVVVGATYQTQLTNGFYTYMETAYGYTFYTTTYTPAPAQQYYSWPAVQYFTPGTAANTGQTSASYSYNYTTYYNETVPGNTNPGTTNPGNTNPGTSNPASYTPGNYVAGNSGTYATNYTTGTAANILGVTFPGGVGGAATVVSATLVSNNPKYGTTTSITIPSGGYATITFTL